MTRADDSRRLWAALVTAWANHQTNPDPTTRTALRAALDNHLAGQHLRGRRTRGCDDHDNDHDDHDQDDDEEKYER